jgi:hypothetical protein
MQRDTRYIWITDTCGHWRVMAVKAVGDIETERATPPVAPWLPRRDKTRSETGSDLDQSAVWRQSGTCLSQAHERCGGRGWGAAGCVVGDGVSMSMLECRRCWL